MRLRTVAVAAAAALTLTSACSSPQAPSGGPVVAVRDAQAVLVAAGLCEPSNDNFPTPGVLDGGNPFAVKVNETMYCTNNISGSGFASSFERDEAYRADIVTDNYYPTAKDSA